MKNYSVNYFLGCSTPEGFVSFFSDLYSFDGSWHPYILKGGAGTGKSSLMKGIASELEKRGYEVDRIHCSSDPFSLDAVICRGLHFSIADGTSPHVIEPRYPGAVENIINLGDYWDRAELSGKASEIIETTRRNALCHERCGRFLAAAGKVRYDTQRICEESILEYKIHAYADRFSRRRFKSTGNHFAAERKIFLSAITPQGVHAYTDTANALADEIIIVDDKTGSASSLLMEELKNLALRNGYDVISCFCPLQPTDRPEHIIIPALNLAFVRKHDEYEFNGALRTIHCERFMEGEALSKHRNRLELNRRICRELVNEAATSLHEAKRIHDEIEKLYIPAMDFSSFDKIKNRILNEIL